MNPPAWRGLTGLARLEARRTLLAASTALYVGWLALLLHARLAPEVGLELSPSPERAARGLAREGMLAGALLWCAPALVLHAAGTIGRWRAGEVDVWGSRPLSRAALLIAAWTGQAAVASLVVLSTGLAVARRVGPGEASWRYVGSQSIAEARRVEAGKPVALRIELPRAEARRPLLARLHLTRRLGGAGGALTRDARLDVVIARGQSRERFTLRLSGRDRHELRVPGASAAQDADYLELELSTVGAGSAVLLPDRTLELFVLDGVEGGACASIAVRAALALAAATALALGLGAWLGAGTAGGLTLALWLLATRSAAIRAWLPGARLTRDLEFVRAGLLPEAFEPLWLLGVLLCVGAGVLLGVLGLRSWRHVW